MPSLVGSEMCIRDRPATDAPTCPRTMCYSNTAEYSNRCVDPNRVAVTLGFPCFYDSPPPRGASRPVPVRAPLHAPRSPSWVRHPVCAGDREGLLCGWDVAPQRGRGRPSGARESQLFFGSVLTRIFSKIGITVDTTTSQAYYMMRTCLVVCCGRAAGGHPLTLGPGVATQLIQLWVGAISRLKTSRLVPSAN